MTVEKLKDDDVELVEKLHVKYAALKRELAKVIVGQEDVIAQTLIAVFSRGHALLVGVPGLAKTLLIRTLSEVLDLGFRRIQFTPDLLPSDITGINYYDQKTTDFIFRRGPIFANIVIADEINRTTPRTQSALLEAMEERQVSIDGVTYKLDEPFFVAATENPIESQGTFPLPEAQVDRFLMKLSLGYPSPDAEKAILTGHIIDSPLSGLLPVCTRADIIAAQNEVRRIHVSERIAEYIVRIIHATRDSDRVRLGVSPRGTLALLHAAQAYAAVEGREYVLPDDVKAVAVPVLAHRIIARSQSASRITDPSENIIDYIIDTISAPIE